MSYPQRCHASTTTTILYKKIKEQPKAKSRGKRRPNGFSKKQTCQVVWSLGMSRRGTAPAKLARLCSKNSGSVRAPWPYARRQDFFAASQERCGTGAFPQRAVHWTWKTSGKRGRQADTPEAVFGHSKKFNPLLPACKRTAHPDQEQQIQSRQGQSRKVMAAGAPGQEDVNQPERFSGLQRTVGAWQLSGPWVARAGASWAFCRPVGGVCGRVRPGRGAGTVCEIQWDPAGSGDRAAQACSEMREPGNTVAHRLCASGLWATGKLAD